MTRVRICHCEYDGGINGKYVLNVKLVSRIDKTLQIWYYQNVLIIQNLQGGTYEKAFVFNTLTNDRIDTDLFL